MDDAKPSSGQDRDAAVAARMAEITGKPLRITPLPPSETEPAFELMAMLRAASKNPDPPPAEVPELFAIKLKHLRLFRAHLGLAAELFRTELEPRDRELAILRTGWHCQAPFEWGEHVKIGKRFGLSSEEIERVTQGSAAPGWNEHDRAILSAVEELIGNAMISDATWAILARDLNEMQLLELPILVAQYQGVAYFQNSLRVSLGKSNTGLEMR
jgi:alkylhydroperoxidase family enzyme